MNLRDNTIHVTHTCMMRIKWLNRNNVGVFVILPATTRKWYIWIWIWWIYWHKVLFLLKYYEYFIVNLKWKLLLGGLTFKSELFFILYQIQMDVCSVFFSNVTLPKRNACVYKELICLSRAAMILLSTIFWLNCFSVKCVTKWIPVHALNPTYVQLRSAKNQFMNR
jgi:hypothetical protein